MSLESLPTQETAPVVKIPELEPEDTPDRVSINPDNLMPLGEIPRLLDAVPPSSFEPGSTDHPLSTSDLLQHFPNEPVAEHPTPDNIPKLD